jgi:hypothetical protein
VVQILLVKRTACYGLRVLGHGAQNKTKIEIWEIRSTCTTEIAKFEFMGELRAVHGCSCRFHGC